MYFQGWTKTFSSLRTLFLWCLHIMNKIFFGVLAIMQFVKRLPRSHSTYFQKSLCFPLDVPCLRKIVATHIFIVCIMWSECFSLILSLMNLLCISSFYFFISLWEIIKSALVLIKKGSHSTEIPSSKMNILFSNQDGTGEMLN